VGDETDVRLARMLRAMAKMTREGREREFAALSAAHEALRREQAEEQQKAAVRARQAQQEPRPGSSDEARRWRRVIGMRYGSGMSAVIWRPGR